MKWRDVSSPKPGALRFLPVLPFSMGMKRHQPAKRRRPRIKWGACYDRVMLTLGTLASWIAVALMLRHG
jgi:hypothetical protein